MTVTRGVYNVPPNATATRRAQASPIPVRPNRFGNVEERYTWLLWSTFYRHKDAFLGYGVKFWPGNLQKLKSTNPQFAVFAERDEKRHDQGIPD